MSPESGKYSLFASKASIFSQASFTNMLNNWVGTLAPLTFHDFWSLFNLWCSNTLFWSADVLLGQSSAQKGTKRYTHEQTESRKRTSTKLTINFLGSIGWVFPHPHPIPISVNVAVPSGTRHGCLVTPPCGFTHTGGVKQPRDPLKGRKGETKTTGIIKLSRWWFQTFLFSPLLVEMIQID